MIELLILASTIFTLPMFYTYNKKIKNCSYELDTFTDERCPNIDHNKIYKITFSTETYISDMIDNVIRYRDRFRSEYICLKVDINTINEGKTNEESICTILFYSCRVLLDNEKCFSPSFALAGNDNFNLIFRLIFYMNSVGYDLEDDKFESNMNSHFYLNFKRQ